MKIFFKRRVSKHIFLLFFLSLGTVSFAQEKVLQLEHQDRELTRTIKEKKRIRVKTTDGLKYKGRFTIIDAQRISIGGTAISLNDIEKIKRDPLLVTAIATGGFVYLGSVTVGLAVIVGIFIEGVSSIPFFAAGGGLVALGLLKPSYLPAKKIANGWSISIKELI